MNDSMGAVAVTGASGYVGACLMRTLEAERGIEKLVAIDTRPPPAPIHNMASYRADVTAPIDEILSRHRVSTLAHLAFTPRRGRNRREVNAVRQANLDALNQTLESCVRARVEHIVHLSSHTVYGARPDNPVPLTGEAPLRPLRDFAYGYDKFLLERALRNFAARHRDKTVTVLRSCIALGPTVDNRMVEGLFRPWLLGVQGYNPPMQFVYEDDLARVIALVIRRRLPGVFNVAGDGVVFYDELARIIESRLVKLPAFLAYPLAQLTWNLRLQQDSPASGLDLVRYPIVMSCARLHRDTGYRFRSTSLEALRAFANYRMVEEGPA